MLPTPSTTWPLPHETVPPKTNTIVVTKLEKQTTSKSKEVRFSPYPLPPKLEEQVNRRLEFVEKRKKEKEEQKNTDQDVVIGLPEEEGAPKKKNDDVVMPGQEDTPYRHFLPYRHLFEKIFLKSHEKSIFL
jgi:hypothetical protein